MVKVDSTSSCCYSCCSLGFRTRTASLASFDRTFPHARLNARSVQLTISIVGLLRVRIARVAELGLVAAEG